MWLLAEKLIIFINRICTKLASEKSRKSSAAAAAKKVCRVIFAQFLLISNDFSARAFDFA